jgi:hypothetical protein
MSTSGNGAGAGSEKGQSDSTPQNERQEGSNQAIQMLDHAMAAATANEAETENEPSASRWAHRAPTASVDSSESMGRPSKVYVHIFPFSCVMCFDMPLACPLYSSIKC